MKSLMLKAYVGAQVFFNSLKEDLKSDERGVSPIVATVLVILITVLLAAIFWGSLKDWFNTLWAQIIGKADTIK